MKHDNKISLHKQQSQPAIWLIKNDQKNFRSATFMVKV